tara:strand:+ start:39442 stop:40623 length:1182 start_codon:yes stop_codon:yes gene_type:complete
MKEIYSNVTIIGGGLIGAVSAIALSKLGLSVVILEKKPSHDIIKKNEDTRTIAISEGTKQFLNKLDLWRKLEKYSEPIKGIKIIDRKPTNILNFDNIRRTSNLGYIIKNKIFINIVYKEVIRKTNIKLYNNTKILNVESANNFSHVITKKFLFKSNLNIASDGKKSFIKNLLKVNDFKKDYKKKALVTTFTHTNSHKNIAYEFFLKNGPLAILPMQKQKNNFVSSIVWTNNIEYIDGVAEVEDNILASILTEKTERIIGNIKTIITKQTFPLSAHLNNHFYVNNTIFVGDSAHSFHPIAGQGWNLGMKDVETLFDLTNTYISLGIEIGGSIFCKEYHDNTYFRAYRLYQLTDKIDKIFKEENGLIYLLRSSGLKFLQKNKNIKNKISDFAMGL